MEYPQDRLEIQVLDDSTDETNRWPRQMVERYRALGHPIVYCIAKIATATKRERWMLA